MPLVVNIFNHVLIILAMAGVAFTSDLGSRKRGKSRKAINLRKGIFLLLTVLGIVFSWYLPIVVPVVILFAIMNYINCLFDDDMPNSCGVLFLLIVLLEILLLLANVWC